MGSKGDNVMGKKIFVSYKYADDKVYNLEWGKNSTVRDYVTKFEEKVANQDDIYKGESNGEDLSKLEDETIWAKLKNRIYDSSVTIIFISPGMKEQGVSDRDQWIPWEVSYSLKETSRTTQTGKSITSKSNAMLAVVLPDQNNSYSYYMENKDCCLSRCVTHHTDKLFKIIRNNMFNYNYSNKRLCENGHTIWTGEFSYIEAVKWEKFISDYKKFVDKACKRQDSIEDYDICKEIE